MTEKPRFENAKRHQFEMIFLTGSKREETAFADWLQVLPLLHSTVDFNWSDFDQLFLLFEVFFELFGFSTELCPGTSALQPVKLPCQYFIAIFTSQNLTSPKKLLNPKLRQILSFLVMHTAHDRYILNFNRLDNYDGKIGMPVCR